VSPPTARWRGTVGGAVIVVALVVPSIASGAGRTYEVVQCDPLNRGVLGAALEDAPSYAVKQGCGDPKEDQAIKISNTRFAQQGRSGRVRWSTQSPSLSIIGASVQAKLRRDRGHTARLWMADAEGDELAKVATGAKGATGFRHYSWRSSGPRPEQFIAHLRCDHRGGCKHSDVAKTWLRNIHFEVADYADPRLQQVGGSLLHHGWIRSGRSVSVHGVDSGSGVQRIVLEANGTAVASGVGFCNRIQGTAATQVFSPCESGLGLDAPVDTNRGPFHDGRNLVSVCLFDFAANTTCSERSVYVDNTPPTLSFTSFQNPDDPELVRAPIADPTSGVARGGIYYRAIGDAVWRSLPTQHRLGQLRTRVNSTSAPPGRYEFMARAADRAGNTAVTTRRSNGRPMVLTFPLKAGVQLHAHLRGGSRRLTVGYGRSSRVAGVLRDASGNPLADQDVTVTEYFGEGALLDTRVRTVQTDSQGHWQERLPGGPSRKVSATYAGSRRYLPDETTAGALRVKTKASLHISHHRVREGHRVAFKGRVGHLAARIPAGGKLVELEVKDGKGWQTVRHPFYTGPDGRYRLRYRFARFYMSDVRYRFRVKVIRERNWPYKAPVSSRVRKLVVKAR
jgi:hypothetical protein